MNRYQYFTDRPHLLMGIILVIVTLILLAAAAAKIWDREEPIDSPAPNNIAAPGNNEAIGQEP